jgi:hypothetical protein
LKPRGIQNEDKEELNGILGLISEHGELILKAKKISVIPKAFYFNRFENILVLDI